MKKIAICDDEPAVRKQMEAYFKELESVFCISYFESGEALLESDVLYDVIFLDIDMKGISGIDTARKIRVRDKKAKIIYVTAYEDFREYAFGVHAFGYLVKPVEKEKILENQKIIRPPIVRNGKQATVGYEPDVWKDWK